MRTSTSDLLGVRAVDVKVTDDELTVQLEDGRTLAVPLVWYPRLLQAWWTPMPVVACWRDVRVRRGQGRSERQKASDHFRGGRVRVPRPVGRSRSGIPITARTKFERSRSAVPGASVSSSWHIPHARTGSESSAHAGRPARSRNSMRK